MTQPTVSKHWRKKLSQSVNSAGCCGKEAVKQV